MMITMKKIVDGPLAGVVVKIFVRQYKPMGPCVLSVATIMSRFKTVIGFVPIAICGYSIERIRQ